MNGDTHIQYTYKHERRNARVAEKGGKSIFIRGIELVVVM